MLSPGERGVRRGTGRAGGGGVGRLGRKRKVKAFLTSRALPRESVERGAGDNGQTELKCVSLRRTVASLGSACAAISLMAQDPQIPPWKGNWCHC